MVFYSQNSYIKNYTHRYVINKALLPTIKTLPNLKSLTLFVSYNPKGYDYPHSYINDFIFLWYKHTNTIFSSHTAFKKFVKKLNLYKTSTIKQSRFGQHYLNEIDMYKFFFVFQNLVSGNVIKEQMFSNKDYFLIKNKNSFTMYNMTNKRDFFIVLKSLNFEKITHGYNFVLNLLDFYTEFNIMFTIMATSVCSYHNAWLLNFIKFSYFFTAEKFNYKKYPR